MVVGAVFWLPALLSAQNPPPPLPRDSARVADSTRKAGAIVIPGLDLPIQVDLRIESKFERDRNLRCNSLEAFQVSSLSGCGGGFLGPSPDFKFSLKSAGKIGDRLNVNVDYDAQREFDASNNITLAYQGAPGASLRRVDVGNINFTPPQSRFLTASLPSGNYGAQASFQIGRLSIKPIFAIQTGNLVQDRQFTLGHVAEQRTDRDIDDYQIEPRRFFFTVDPTLFGSAYPNIDILDRAQLGRLRLRLPETMRPTRVLVYRLQFGTQPQNLSGPQFRLQSDGPGGARQTYDLLREGVDYFMDQSLLWFALVRPLNSANERLVVTYNVRVNGRDTVIASTGGTPDLKIDRTHDQVANLVSDPSVGPSSPAFRNEIRSAYRLAGPDLIRNTAQVRVVTGGGLLEHPLAGSDATFLQMFGLAQSTNPAEFDYNNRIWPRPSDAVLDLGAGAPDVRTPGSIGSTHVIRDHFIVFPSLQPFSPRDSGLVTVGNPTNSPIYSTPGDYLYSTQHPTSVYRIHVQYQTSATDEPGVVTLGATQMRPGSERIIIGGRTLVKDLDYHIDYDLGRIDFVRPDTLFSTERLVSVRYEDNASAFIASQTTLGGITAELPVSHGVFDFSAIRQSQSSPFTRPQLGFQDNAMLTAGVTAQFSWNATALTRWASKLPSSDGKTASHFSLQGEIATSKPQFGSSGEAYVTDFEGSGGLSIALGDGAWHYSSLPAYGHTLRSPIFGGALFELNRASTMVWQTYVQTLGGTQIKFTQSSIDPLVVLSGAAVEPNEPVMWLTLLPLDQRGRFNRAKKGYDWTVAN
ncbi:MAG: cell surface protein SprA, partial [Gemmatimonadaceae bacterium]